MKSSQLTWMTDSQFQNEQQLAKSIVHALVKGFGMYPEAAVEVVARSCAANKF